MVKTLTFSLQLLQPRGSGCEGSSSKLQTSELNPLLMQQQISFLAEEVRLRQLCFETADEPLTHEHERIRFSMVAHSSGFTPCQTGENLVQLQLGLLAMLH